MMRGFTLIEVVVAIVLLELGVLGILGTLVIASRTMTRAEALERGAAVVERVADSLSAHGLADGGAVAFDGGRVTWSAGDEQVVVAVGEAGDTLVRAVVPVPR